MDRIAHSEDNFERVYLVGVRLWPDSEEPDLYTIVLYNEVAREDQNRPLTHGDRIVFFKNADQADAALALGDAAFRKYASVRAKVDYIYDVPLVLRLLRGAERDDSGIIADFINELLDFVAATNWSVPASYRALLHALADHATFDRNLASFFAFSGERRQETLNATLWCLGAVLSAATEL